jgi:hypothetical protein
MLGLACHPSRDVETDVLVAVFGFEKKKFGTDSIGRVLIDLGTEKHNALSKKSLIEVVCAETVCH